VRECSNAALTLRHVELSSRTSSCRFVLTSTLRRCMFQAPHGVSVYRVGAHQARGDLHLLRLGGQPHPIPAAAQPPAAMWLVPSRRAASSAAACYKRGMNQSVLAHHTGGDLHLFVCRGSSHGRLQRLRRHRRCIVLRETPNMTDWSECIREASICADPPQPAPAGVPASCRFVSRQLGAPPPTLQALSDGRIQHRIKLMPNADLLRNSTILPPVPRGQCRRLRLTKRCDMSF